MDIFSIFFNMKVCCVLSLESPNGGDSNEYTQYTVFNIKKITLAINFVSTLNRRWFDITTLNQR